MRLPFPFFKKKGSVLGVDIGTSSIKIVELSRKGVKTRLLNYAILSSFEGSGYAGDASETASFRAKEEEVVDMIQREIGEARIQSRLASFSIPVYSSFFTVIDFPKMDREEIVKAIPYEARRYIPVPLPEVVLSSHLIPSKSSRGSDTSVLLVAVPREIIERYKRIARACNLKLYSLEVENLSLARSLLLAPRHTGKTLLLDIGARVTSINVVEDGYIRLTHHSDMAGDAFTEAIAHGMGLTSFKAEALKRSTGILGRGGEETISSIIFPILDTIYLETLKTLDLWRDKHPDKKIENCVLSGGSANMAGIIDYFVEKLAVSVAVGNPFTGIVYPEALDATLKEIAPLAAVATGLAMRTLR